MEGTVQNENKLVGTLSSDGSMVGGMAAVLAKDGEDGYSPTINAYREGNVTTIVIQDIEGVKTTSLNDGFSPIINIEEIDGGHRVFIADGEGYKSFDVMDGKDGQGGTGGGGATKGVSGEISIESLPIGMSYAEADTFIEYSIDNEMGVTEKEYVESGSCIFTTFGKIPDSNDGLQDAYTVYIIPRNHNVYDDYNNESTVIIKKIAPYADSQYGVTYSVKEIEAGGGSNVIVDSYISDDPDYGYLHPNNVPSVSAVVDYVSRNAGTGGESGGTADNILKFITSTDTLIWDGNKDGLESFDMMGDGSYVYYRVSDNVVSLEDLANGVTIESFSPDGTMTDEITLNDFAFMGSDVIASESVSILLFVLEDDVSFYRGTISKKGIYFMSSELYGTTTGIVIKGYTGFNTQKKVIKDIYMPPIVDEIKAYVDETILGGEW